MTTPAKTLLLNCDMGESFGPWVMGSDELVMPVIDMANIACGFHASDPDTMARTVALAVEHNVQIGAHPGYADKEGFGRRAIPHSPEQIIRLTLYQAGALNALCAQAKTGISYIKPHGALYHDMMAKEDVFLALLQCCAFLPEAPALVIQATANNSHYLKLAEQHNVKVIQEAFADRVYNNSGQLVPRTQKGAVHHNPEAICKQAQQIVQQGSVTTIQGELLPLQADTLCVHGDNPEAVAVIHAIKKSLQL
ncbi:5-oxoprolinase subunit PxpA [Parendozoicomonas sp. Alg238-R29]|uniref:5-oxoprolinase subunit PxpA n=1 Tax=Parendozoicomonas sp. Alg238-R29 TaxID=2993446 RepID=UPI00248D850D|nr:5-oxoprolinase subunit PxpA [Parendozoicomonas sp. Alg238-R29]